MAAITPKECHDLMLRLTQQGSGRRGCASSVGELDAYDGAALFSETDGSDGSVEDVCHRPSQSSSSRVKISSTVFPK